MTGVSGSNAPIALFVWKRPLHTQETLSALMANSLAATSDLFVFADAEKSESQAVDVRHVREIVRQVTGFRSVTVIERERNFGLTENMIDGVSHVCKGYGRAIVLEDDVVVAPTFLSFMNVALETYERNKLVWHINGWNYPIDVAGIGQTFFSRNMNCWGWATWQDRWNQFRREPERLIREWDQKAVRRFNLEGAFDFWDQVIRNASGRLDSWAVFWYATIFEAGGLCLNPTFSLTANIGFDGSGENCGSTVIIQRPLDAIAINALPDVVGEDELAIRRIRRHLELMKPNLATRVSNKIRQFASIWRSARK